MTAHVDGSAAKAGGELPLVFVTVGSDYHPFSRLISWVDGWLADGGAQRARCLMQFGTAAAPAHAGGEPFIDHGQVIELMSVSTVVVAQGGPMTLIEAARQGRLPIAVPRTRSLGEVVDDHQHAFCHHLQRQGQAVVATDEARLRDLLNQALAQPDRFRLNLDAEDDRIAATVTRFSSIAEQLLEQRHARNPRGLRLPRPRRRRSAKSTTSEGRTP